MFSGELNYRFKSDVKKFDILGNTLIHFLAGSEMIED